MAKEQANKTASMYENVLEQFNKVADRMDLDPDIRKILSNTNNEVSVSFPVRMDDDSIEVFRGFRVQHNNALGPYKGGLRYHPSISLDDSRALAMWMTWKSSLAGLPFGGAKGGLELEPEKYSIRELERITRRFAFALGANIGPDIDIVAPDVNTNAQMMAWFSDTFMQTHSTTERLLNQNVATGKPIEFGGVHGRDRSTGFTVYLAIKLFLEIKGQRLKDKTYILQGFGNVGQWLAHFMYQEGAKMIAVQDAHSTKYNSDGINPRKLLKHLEKHGNINDFAEAEEMDRDEFFGLECDVLVPAALGNQININNAHQVRAKTVAEGANGPVTSKAEEILLDNGINVIPDFLCNSGGVIGSYFEWLQNRKGEMYTIEEVLQRTENKFTTSFDQVVKTVEDYETDWRTACYILAILRIETLYKLRGIFP